MSSNLRLHASGRSRAVLVGTWNYEYLPEAPAARHSLDRLAELLRNPLCGWLPDDITRIENQETSGDLADHLMALYEDVTNVALFYYVGHGQVDDDDQLCLGLVRSREELHRRATSSLQFSAVRRALRHSSAAVKIAILDCCYSGHATQPHNSLGVRVLESEAFIDLAVGTGAYVMAACSPYCTAWYEPDSVGSQPQTYFTKYLADTVMAGISGQPAGLTLSSLFETVRCKLENDGLPIPSNRIVGNLHGYIFADNAAPIEMQQDIGVVIQRKRAELRELEKHYADLQVSKGVTQGSARTGQEVDNSARRLRRSRTELEDLRAVAQGSDTIEERVPIFSVTESGQFIRNDVLDGSGLPKMQQIGETSNEVIKRLRSLRELAGSPTPQEISSLTKRGGACVTEQEVREVLGGHTEISLEQTLAIAHACCLHADESGRNIPRSEYERDVWHSRYERVRTAGAGLSEPRVGPGSPFAPKVGISDQGIEPHSSTTSEEVKEARLLVTQGRTKDAEAVLRREARNGSVEAMHEVANLYARQGRRREAEHALREAAEAGSIHAVERLERMARRNEGR